MRGNGSVFLRYVISLINLSRGTTRTTLFENSLISLSGSKAPFSVRWSQLNGSLFPVVNVDGYEYSWTTDRLWRKNRQPTPVPFCTGIDPDKSWDYMWNAPDSQPFNSNPCSESHSPPLHYKAY